MDEDARLKTLNLELRDQDDLERDIGREADRLLVQQANQRDQQRLEKAVALKEKLTNKIAANKEQISKPIGVTQKGKLKAENERLQAQIQDAENDVADIQDRIAQRDGEAKAVQAGDAATAGRLPGESQRDFLIRTGKITPFSKFGLSSHGESLATLTGALLDAEEDPDNAEPDFEDNTTSALSHRNLRQPGFAEDHEDASEQEEFDSDQPRKKRKLERSSHRPSRAPRAKSSDDGDSDEYHVEDDLVEESDGLDDDDEMPTSEGRTKRGKGQGPRIDLDVEDFNGVDDGRESVYRARLRQWAMRRRAARLRHTIQSDPQNGDAEEHGHEEDLAEAYMPHPTTPDTDFEDGFKIPGDIFPSLFDYQKTGVQWLYELHLQQVGGIVGDEMGLGKTIQIIAFLAGLHYSRKLDKPVIVVCPATVMRQWVNEFHKWWPPLRVTILHSSGSGMVNLVNESSQEERLEDQLWDPSARKRPLTAAQKSAKRMLQPVLQEGGVLVTTYSGLQTYAPLLIPVEWSYAILDEGHKIRNPNTAITIYCKELRTPNRIILSGTPMQNNLIELWSLFDFIFPMRLGTLVSFRNQFDIPIRQGGYANASNLQVQTALKCAETLKDAISPYLLQRFKVDVAADLPKKSEQVLFCKLTKLQRDEYKRFLNSGDMDAIMSGKRQVLYGIDILRKICNHPDLQDHRRLSVKAGYNYGDPAKSGKMDVVASLLELWRDTGHKTLLFAQHRIMLDILERLIRSKSGLKYRRMDGSTPIAVRQSMVDEFNSDPNLHVFLLTTKVGGLGVNLTGADRVLIYDPDWNPSTDLQARERAWRLGQKREVTIYRLMTAGTIEEKIYHRQIFKQFLTNKILKDPKQRQTFHLSDLHDLFTLGEESAPTETSTLFKDAQLKYGNTKPAEESTQPHTTAIKSEAAADSSSEQDRTMVKALPGISSVEQYAGEIAEEEEQQANEDNQSKGEARMMEGIFSRSGIHSAMEHDAIISGNSGKKKVAADPVLIEQEARKVAAEAAKELRKAGEIARTVPIGTPTWTGQFGVSGRPTETTAQRAFGGGSSRHRANGPQSSSLLVGLQQRQAIAAGATTASANPTQGILSPSRQPSPAPSSTTTTTTTTPSRHASPATAIATTPPRGKDFGKLIRDYLVSHGGSAYTQMLIDHFNRYCSTERATAEFKETLKLIARLERGGRARGRWILKDEYK